MVDEIKLQEASVPANMPMGKYIIIMLILSVVINSFLTWLSIAYGDKADFTRYGVAIGFAFFGAFMLLVFDKYILKKYDILDEIFEKRNIAVAIFVLAYVLAFIVAPLIAS